MAIAACLVMILATLGWKVATAKYQYKSQATVQIDAPPERVFQLIGNLRHWPSWSPFLPANAPQIQIDQTTSPPTMYWNDPRGGQARLTLDQMDGVERTVQHTLHSAIFPPMTGEFQVTEADGASQVTWNVEGSIPKSFFYALAAGNYGEMMQGQLQQSLDRLKTVAEKETDNLELPTNGETEPESNPTPPESLVPSGQSTD